MAKNGNFLENLTASYFGRVIFIGVIILVLEIPVAMVHDVIRERSRYQESAAAEITSLWGGSQTFAGPKMVARYRCTVAVHDGTRPEIGPRTREVIRHVVFLPDALTIDGRTETELLRRGIFELPVYRSQLQVKGRVSAPELSELGLDAENAQLEDMALVIDVADPRTLQRISQLSWNDEQLAFEPGSERDGTTGALSAPVGLLEDGGQAEFSFDVELNGSASLFFVPSGRTTQITLRSDWPEPSFAGAWLPSERNVDADGFTASWRIPYLGRKLPVYWFADHPPEEQIQQSAFGVRLISAVDAYRMAERSVKYATLFLVLTFSALWLVDVLTKVSIHPLQYLLVGAAMCVFYLMELSLAEHIGFGAAYTLATVTVVGTIVLYGIPVLGGFGRSSVISLLLAALYGYLYIVLLNQDHALLAGTTLLFASLATVMYLTRNIDWFALTARRVEESRSG
jgi:inner membrane protein